MTGRSALGRALEGARITALGLNDSITRKDAIAFLRSMGWTRPAHWSQGVEAESRDRSLEPDMVVIRVTISGSRVKKISMAIASPGAPILFHRQFKRVPSAQRAVQIMS